MKDDRGREEEDEEEIEAVEDGLRGHYEVVVVGTGLVQSLVAAAVSKRGRTLLAVDPRDLYGGEHGCTRPLGEFLSRVSTMRGATPGTNGNGDGAEEKEVKKESFDDHSDNSRIDEKNVSDKDGNEDIQKIARFLNKKGFSLSLSHENTLAWINGLNESSLDDNVALVDCSDSCHNGAKELQKAEEKIVLIRSARDGSPACRGYRMERTPPPTGNNCMDSNVLHPCFFGYRGDHEQTIRRMLFDQRSFQIDANPKLLLSAGKMVDAIIASGVGNYLEFKPVESLYFVSSKNPNKKAKDLEASAVDVSSAASLLQLWKVPCCKKDIFNTKMFTALEKRSLMKLMQFAVDHGRQNDGLPVTTLNESELAQGRSLFRPQNKSIPAGKEISHSSDADNCFSEFLQNASIPERLQGFVTHALCLDPRPADRIPSSRQGLENLYRHVNASGRYGETSFLIPVYGTSEFSQAFCRLSAVWGGVFLLRETISKMLTTSSTDSSNTLKSDETPVDDTQEVNARAVVLKLTNDKYIACDHIICDEKFHRQFALPPFDSKHAGEEIQCVRLVQRQIVLSRPLLSPAGGQDGQEGARGVCILPANTPSLGNSHAVYLLQLDESTQVAPRGAFLAYLTTYIPSRLPLHGLSLASKQLQQIDEEERAMASRLMTSVTTLLRGLGTERESEEMFYATFLHPPQLDTTSAAPLKSKLSNVHLCDNSNEKVLYIHNAVAQAEAIFRSMFPEDVFLEDTEENNTAQTRVEPEADDDGLGAILSSAQAIAASTGGGDMDTRGSDIAHKKLPDPPA